MRRYSSLQASTRPSKWPWIAPAPEDSKKARRRDSLSRSPLGGPEGGRVEVVARDAERAVGRADAVQLPLVPLDGVGVGAGVDEVAGAVRLAGLQRAPEGRDDRRRDLRRPEDAHGLLEGAPDEGPDVDEGALLRAPVHRGDAEL
jgi:hypothetical protein